MVDPNEELMIDSSSWIEFFRGSKIGEQVAEHLSMASNITLNVALAEVTCKVYEGVSDPQVAKALIDSVLALSRIEMFTAEQAIRAGQLRATFIKAGRQVSYADCLQMMVARDRSIKVLSKDKIFAEVAEGICLTED